MNPVLEMEPETTEETEVEEQPDTPAEETPAEETPEDPDPDDAEPTSKYTGGVIPEHSN